MRLHKYTSKHLDRFRIAHGENERRWLARCPGARTYAPRLRRPGRGACVGWRCWPARTVGHPGTGGACGLRARRTRAQVVRGSSAIDGREEAGARTAPPPTTSFRSANDLRVEIETIYSSVGHVSSDRGNAIIFFKKKTKVSFAFFFSLSHNSYHIKCLNTN